LTLLQNTIYISRLLKNNVSYMNFHFKIKGALYRNMETVIPGFLGFKHFSNQSTADLQHSPFPKLFYFHSQLLPKSFEDHTNLVKKTEKSNYISYWLHGCSRAPIQRKEKTERTWKHKGKWRKQMFCCCNEPKSELA